MGSIGIIFLDYSAKSKIFNLPKHIQLLRCGPLLRASLRRPGSRRSVAQRSAGRWPRSSRTRIRRPTQGRARLQSEVGGDEETRTPDPLLAKEMLYQLSYVPDVRWVGDGGRFWTRTRDLCLIRAVL